MKKIKRQSNGWTDRVYYITRIGTLLALVMMFFPAANPAYVSGLINKNLSLFTTAISYDSLTSLAGRPLRMGWVQSGDFVVLMIGAAVLCLGIALTAVCACMSLGNLKMKHVGNWFGLAGTVTMFGGMAGIYLAYQRFCATDRPDKVYTTKLENGEYINEFPVPMYLFLALAAVLLISTLVIIVCQPKPNKEDKYEIATPYKLFLFFLPIAAFAFVFCYLPLYGWRYAFFDYNTGETLSWDKFVGFKWFTYLFENAKTRSDIINVLKNTLIMSGLGIATSWVPMAFAIFLTEIKCGWFRRFVQTFTTIPNFISWVLVYAIALAIFATDGFLNNFLTSVTGELHEVNHLLDANGIWFKMLAWGMWKGVGWSAIIYVAGISGIDQQLYEAATVDGAGRFQKMWHITVPGLIPTFCVLLLMSVAGILSNGMDQYLVFENASNKDAIRVLDLYVYQIGIGGGLVPLSTVVGMVKTIVSVILLFAANGISKLVRGESIM
ncbi:MAG: sugar ABC transporter permease [Lachnospiraceae bacterium]|nr:sugar ABC transporter permease [Lachnospiraceae bacterium]